MRSILAFLALLVVVQGLLSSPGLALKRAEKYLATPEMEKLVYEDVIIDTPDGPTLHGWFFPFQDDGGRAYKDPEPIVILVTDGTENMGSLLWHYFEFLRGTPWHVLMFDWRGMGGSSSWDIDTTQVVIPEQRIDLRSAIEYAKERPEFNGKLGIFAYGAGAAVVLAIAAEDHDLQAIALRGVYTTQSAYCAKRLASSPPSGACSPNSQWPSELEPIRAAARVKAPTFIVVGEDDRITPRGMAQAVHDSLGGEKEFWAAPKAGHDGYECPEAVHTGPFRVKLRGFLGRYLGKRQEPPIHPWPGR